MAASKVAITQPRPFVNDHLSRPFNLHHRIQRVTLGWVTHGVVAMLRFQVVCEYRVGDEGVGMSSYEKS
jgi:hypothetical protein